MTEMFLKFLALVGLACLGFYAAYLAFTVYAGTDIPTVLIFMIFLIPLGVALNWVFKLPSVASVVNVAAGLTCLLFLGGQVAFDFRFGRDLVAATEDALDPVRAWDNAISNQPIDDSDLLPLLPILDEMRSLPAGYNSDFTERPSLAVVGPEQLHRASVQAYLDTLNRQMLPRLLLRLENRMWENINSPEVLYDLLKTYLMLGQLAPFDAQFVQSVFNVDWRQTYRGTAAYDTLNAHLAAILEYPMESIDLDGALIDRAQRQIAQVPIAVMAYRSILSSTAALDLPEFRLTEAGGPAVARVFQRASGASLAEGIPGIYTYQGFHSEFLPALAQVDDLVSESRWVLGPYMSQRQQNVFAVVQDVLRLYEEDFAAQYEDLLGDLDIVPVNNFLQAGDVTDILSGPASPLERILRAVAEETRLTDQRGPEPNQQSTLRTLDQQQFLAVLLRDTGIRPGTWVAQRFAGLQSLVERPDGLPSELDQLLDSITDVHLALNYAAAVGSAEGIEDALAKFRTEAAQFGEPIPRWAQQLDIVTVSTGGQSARARANAIWQAEVLPFCEAASYSYPFDWKAEVGIPIDDFTQLFGPGGLIDVFFQENLAAYVDTSGPQWRLIEDSGLSVSETVLRQMQNAAEIREAFFLGGSLGIVFSLSLETLDERSSRVEVSLDGRLVNVFHIETPETITFRWDGTAEGAGIAFAPDTLKGSQFRGAWAPFRLFSSGQLIETDDHVRVVLSRGQNEAIFRMYVGNALNPFVLPAFSEFSCPRSL